MPTVPHLPPFGVKSVWIVLSTLSTGPWAIFTFVTELGAAAWYARRVRLLAELRKRRWPARRSVFFALGILSCMLAWQTGVPLYAGSVFTVHVIQHLALMLAAPICFALSAPLTLAMQTMERDRKTRTIRFLRSRPVHFLTNPVIAGAFNYGIMYWFFLDKGIAIAMPRPDLMDFVNVCFLFFGSLVWWPVSSIDYIGRRRYPYAARIGIAMAGMPFDSFLAIALLGGAAKQSIAPGMYSLASVEAGASVFWIMAGFLSGLGILSTILRWIRHEERSARRYDGKLAELKVQGNELDIRRGEEGGFVVVGPDGRFVIVGPETD